MKIGGQELVAGTVVYFYEHNKYTVWQRIKQVFSPTGTEVKRLVEGDPKRRPPIYPAEWPRNLMKSLSEAGPPVPREDDGSTMIDIGTTEPPDGFVLDDKDDMGPGRYQ